MVEQKTLDSIADVVIGIVEWCWPWAGFVFGLSIFQLWKARSGHIGVWQWWLTVVLGSALVGPVACFFLSDFLWCVAKKDLATTTYAYVGHIGGVFFGIVTHIWCGRFLRPWLNSISHKWTRKSSLERNKKTDVRNIWQHLPAEGRTYAPEKYFERFPKRERGIFCGLDDSRAPIYIPYEKWRKSHVQITGTTGSGKGVVAAVLLAQALRAGEAVFVLDPKDDEWAPHVLKAQAERVGVPFYLVDLRKDVPQLDLLAEVTHSELEELFISGFSLAEKGEAADFYRIADRSAACSAATLVVSGARDFRQIFLDDRIQSSQKEATGFFGKLKELAEVGAINAAGGLDLATIARGGGCVYVLGSMRHSRIVMAQRMLFVRLLQVAERRDRVRGTPRTMCVFLDELKYHISRPALEGLATARDKGMHLLLAHQALADLRDCPADLKPEAVVGAVVENCAIRLAYRVQNPETAKWLAAMSGEILVDDEVRCVDRNAGGAELMQHNRTVRQATRQFVDTNMLLNLPDRTAVLFGAGLPKFVHICPIKAKKAEVEPHRPLESAVARPSKHKSIVSGSVELEMPDVNI